MAYFRYEACTYVWAPIGLHLIVRLWSNRWVPLRLLYLARLYYVQEGSMFSDGRFCWPWSKCWSDQLKRYIETARASGYAQGVSDERRRQIEEINAFFKRRSTATP